MSVPASSDRESTPSQTTIQQTNPPSESAAEQSPDRVGDILQQILSASERGDAAGTEDPCRGELLAVAAKYSAQEFCQEPVLLELVQVLTGRIRGLSPARRAALEKSVATSLYEDQSSLGRLQLLWTQLTRLAAHAE